jgi:hypothetical protein
VLAAEGDLAEAQAAELTKLGYRVLSVPDTLKSANYNLKSSDLSPALLWLAAIAFAAELLLLAL